MSPALDELDAALVRLRRLWERPEAKRWFLEQLGEPVDITLVRTLRAVEWVDADEAGVADVAGALSVDESTASRLVDAAVGAGYVVRARSTRDRRRCVLTLSPAGRGLLERATAARAAHLAAMTRDWAEADVARLAQLLGRLAAATATVGPAAAGPDPPPATASGSGSAAAGAHPHANADVPSSTARELSRR